MYQEELLKNIPTDFADNSRVWIYQSSRPFNEQEEKEINEQLYQFYVQWRSHGDAVKGWAKLMFNNFIIMIADETEVSLGGCSTDSSTRVLKSFERQYNVTLFDRMSLTFLVKDKPQSLPYNQLQYAIDNGFINGDTLMFNNLVPTKKELLAHWLQPLKDTWLKDRIVLKDSVL